MLNHIELPTWAATPLVLAAAGAAGLIIHFAAFAVGSRAAARTRTIADDAVVARLRGPTRWLIVAVALMVASSGLHLPQEQTRVVRQVGGLLTPALLGWLAISLVSAVKDIVTARADITVEDNLRARRRRTRVSILGRIATSLILLLTFCLMLMSIPAIRSIGVTLIASAGLAALAVGAAAQPALKNLVAGLQMAFTEPIRIDDVVIIDGEWGRIEDIKLTYVVVKIWDERRLVVPVSRFLEQSFQNWTRETSQLLGSVILYLDPATDIARLRAKLGEIVPTNPRWDGRFFNLQVTDMRAEVIEVRALVTAKDASLAFDLRCDVREALLDFIRKDMPEALPRRRIDGISQASERAAADAP